MEPYFQHSNNLEHHGLMVQWCDVLGSDGYHENFCEWFTSLNQLAENESCSNPTFSPAYFCIWFLMLHGKGPA